MPVWAFITLFTLTASAAKKPFTVVLDPGHGGSDQGAVFYRGSQAIREKDLTLQIARETQRQLESAGFKVVLTRERDTTLALSDRTALANRLKADAFLSIHMNSSHNGSAEGVETYVLNHSTDRSSQRLAELEGSVSALHGSIAANAGHKDVALIVKDLMLDGNFEESHRMACNLQSELVRSTAPGRTIASRNRGVKQALFYVLLGADMPSALLEMGFIHSFRDRALALSPEGRKKMGLAVTRALMNFRYSKKLAKCDSSSI